ncbi:MAG: UDP-3-O-(3-hydroxymyristoyl)glucosamine N-acyltransferase, partial [Sphingobacteriales bacterium]
VPSQPVKPTLIKVKDPYSAFSVLLEKYNEAVNQTQKQTGIEPMSFVHPSAKIGKDVYIAAFAYIAENVEIGDGAKIHSQCYIGQDSKLGTNCLIYAGVKVYHNTQIGNNVIIRHKLF